MKKSLPIFLLALFWVNSLMAGVVTEKQALQKAQKFMKGKSFVVADSRAMSRSKAAEEPNSFYVFNAENQGGFVIVSGDDRTPEILGYADSGEMDMENLPSNVKAWLDGYDQQIKSLGNRQVKALTSTSRAAVEPLIKTQWDQTAPYNLQCPTIGGQHCVTGCTATAIAQIMYYWKTPTTVTPALESYDVMKRNSETQVWEAQFNVPALPATTFKWDKMKTTYGDSDTEESQQAVAELMRYVGQSEKMAYGLDESGASFLGYWLSNFGYNKGAATYIERTGYTTEQWENVIYAELVAKRPVLYEGNNTWTGHAFICDGYDGNSRFHINWGWGGKSDGYYLLSVLNNESDGWGSYEVLNGFNINQAAYIGIHPAQGNEAIYFTSASPEGVNVQYIITSDKDGNRTCQVNGNGETAIPKNYEGVLTIPSTVIYNNKEYQVTSIGADAFRNCSFNTINLPSTLTEIRSGAFAYLSNLSAFELPASVVTVGNVLFERCDNLKTLTVASGNAKYSSPYNCNAIIETSTNTLVTGCKSTVIPECVTAIGSRAFSNRSGLNLTLPATVTSIGYGAFAYCKDGVLTVSFETPLNITDEVFYGINNFKLKILAGAKYNYWNATGWSVFGDNILVDDEGTEFQTNVGNLSMWFTVTGENTVKVGHLIGTKTNLAIDANSAGAIDLPKTVEHDGKVYKITEIGSYAFNNCSSLTSVTIPDGVTSIGDYAFYYCTNLTSVIISEGVTSIGNRAFYYCRSLISVTIPSSVTSIGDYAFAYCYSLNDVTSEIKNPFAIDATAFLELRSDATLYVPYGCKARYETTDGWKDSFSKIVEGGKEFQLVVSNVPVWFTVTGENIVKVGRKGSSAENLAIDASTTGAIDLPETVEHDGKEYRITEIGSYAFYYCKNLTSVTIPSSVTSIGNHAFYCCKGLSSVSIPNSVTSIGYDAFAYCYSLNDVTSEIKNPFAIDATVFSSINSDATLYVPYGCKARYEATDGWKDSFSKIAEGGGEFQLVVSNVPVWFTVTGENSVKVGRKAGSVENLAIDASTTGVVELPETVEHDGKVYKITEIGSYAFYNCSELTSVTIPNGVTSIGGDAFSGCSSLTSVIIPDGVTSIGDNAFYYCTGLTSVIISEGVTSIGYCAFFYCRGLISVTIPSSVTSIGYYAFAYCYSLNDVTSEIKNPFAIDATAFLELRSDATLYVPYGCKARYETTDGWKDSFSKIVEGGKEFQLVVSNVPVWFTVTGENIVKVGRKGSNAENLAIDASTTGAIDLPETVEHDGTVYRITEIGSYAFYNCKGLTSVIIPSSVTSIGNRAFYYCRGLSSVSIPNSIISIGGAAFFRCYGLTSVTIPSSVTSIGSSAFAFCESLKDVNSEIKNPYAINATTFSYLSSDITLHVPFGCKALYEETDGWKDAFSQIVEMSDGIVANNVTYKMTDDNKIEVKTAEVNKTTGSVSIAQKVVVNNEAVTVTAIAPKAFQNVEAVKSVTIPATVESIGDLAFAGCKNLKEVLCLNPDPVNLSVAAARGLLRDGNSGSTVSQFDGVNLDNCTLYVLTAAENDYRNAQGWNSFGTIKPFAGMGDVNTDKAIDVSDVVGEVNQILGKASEGFLYGAGDMNADNSIDVSDVVSIVNVILGKTAAARSMERLSAVAETTATDHLSLMAGNEGGLSLVLDNTADYIAAQFDVRLSEGQTLEQVTKGQRARGHQLATAKMSDGVYRVLLYTIGDRTFSGQSGEVVSLGVAGQGDVTVENITFITAGESRKKFDDLSNQLTGIGALIDDNGEMINDKVEWYDLQGRKLETAPTTKGVYLKNGKKVVVK